MAAVLKEYDGKVRFVHGEFPLSSNHAGRLRRPRFALRRRAGQVLGLPPQPPRDARRTSDEDLANRASGMGLDGKAFGACVQSGRHDAAIQASQEEGPGAASTRPRRSSSTAASSRERPPSRSSGASWTRSCAKGR